MSQQETKENFNANENARESDNLQNEKAAESRPLEPGEVDKLPVESIGSYAKIDELLVEEDSENSVSESQKF